MTDPPRRSWQEPSTLDLIRGYLTNAEEERLHKLEAAATAVQAELTPDEKLRLQTLLSGGVFELIAERQREERIEASRERGLSAAPRSVPYAGHIRRWSDLQDTIVSAPGPWWRALVCWLRGHRFPIVSRHDFSPGKTYRCPRCGTPVQPVGDSKGRP